MAIRSVAWGREHERVTSLGHDKSDIHLMWPPGYMLVLLIEVENKAEEAGLVGR